MAIEPTPSSLIVSFQKWSTDVYSPFSKQEKLGSVPTFFIHNESTLAIDSKDVSMFFDPFSIALLAKPTLR